jgi:DNA-binding HxlR family transcriptional regulator
MDADSPPPARVRAGGTVLSLLAGPLCAPILRAHLDGPLRLPDLRERMGGAAQTTLRGQVGNLRALGALERHVRSSMPYTVENELTGLGHAIVGVADLVETWLARAPQGPIALGSEPGKSAIRALVAGWDSTMLSVLAAGPLSLTELDGAVADVSYPSLERRLSAMRAARQVEMTPDGAGAGKPYSVTKWTRQAVVPLMAAGRCEREHLPAASEPLTQSDVETLLLLAAPLAELPTGAGGSCLIAVGDADGDGEEDEGVRAGVTVEIERGEVVSCTPGPGSRHAALAMGGVELWTAAILDGRFEGLEVDGGDPGLAGALLQGVRQALL